jgi:hypothetical protein
MSDERAIERLPEEAYTVLDRLDEKMIGSELAGLVDYGAQELIYSFKIDGKDVTGLSWAGAKTLARWMAEKGHPLDAEELRITSDDEAWYAEVKIVDKETGLGLWGTSKADKMKEIHVVDGNRSWVKNPDGTWKMMEKPDGFARTIALNKAQRNAILSHVPDKLIAQFIKQAIDEGKVRRVSPEEVEGYGPRKAVESEKKIREPAKEKATPPPAEKAAPEKKTPPPAKGPEETIYRALEAAGLDPTPLTIYVYGRKIYVDPVPMPDGVLQNYGGVLSGLGAVWRQIGKMGRWEIELP